MKNETNEIRETRSAMIPDKDLEARGLPPFCISRNPTDGKLIVLKRGQMGYYPIKEINLPAAIRDEMTLEEINALIRVDAAQLEAMKAGSMFGFHVPGAFPDIYRKKSL